VDDNEGEHKDAENVRHPSGLPSSDEQALRLAGGLLVAACLHLNASPSTSVLVQQIFRSEGFAWGSKWVSVWTGGCHVDMT
jgi:hypothetical protein